MTNTECLLLGTISYLLGGIFQYDKEYGAKLWNLAKANMLAKGLTEEAMSLDELFGGANET